MSTVESLRAAALANVESDLPGVVLQVGDRILWVYPVDDEVIWFLDARTVSEADAEAFLGGADDPRRTEAAVTSSKRIEASRNRALY